MLQRLIPMALVAMATFVFTDDASARHRHRRCCCRCQTWTQPACCQTAFAPAPACGGCASGACGFADAGIQQAAPCCNTQVIGHEGAYAPPPMQPENAPAPPQEAAPPPAPVPPNGQ